MFMVARWDNAVFMVGLVSGSKAPNKAGTSHLLKNVL